MSDLSQSADPDVPKDAVVLTRIIVERLLYPDGQDVVGFYAVDRDGQVPPLLEMLGVLEMAKATAWQAADEAAEDEDED